MMLSPECEYRLLKGKSVEEIRERIKELNEEIARLKEELADPDYMLKPHMKPDETVQLKMCRQYLEKAKKALKEAGGK